LALFSLFSLILEAKSTLLCRLLIDTRHPATFSVVFRPCCHKLWSCRSSAPRSWSSLLCSAREDHTPPFSGCARLQPVIRRRISVWVVPVTAHVLHAPSSGILAFSPTADSLFWVFFTYVFFVFFSCFSSLSLLVFESNFVGIFVG
jgi:hypothetical protein